jgi:sulfide:quinone oxidoreductase
MDIVIAGGGIAGLEALLAVRTWAPDHARLTLISPDPDFSYRPLAVAEPFGLGHAHRVPLRRFAADAGAELIIDAVVGVDDAARDVRLRDGGAQRFEALIVAPGGRAVAGVEGATTWWPGGDAESYGGLLRDIDEGFAKRVAIVIPAGSVWPLPAYELALMTAGEAQAMGQPDVKITVVTPERVPLTLFGEAAGKALAEELRWAGVDVVTGAVARRAERGSLVLAPSGDRLDVQRAFAIPRIVGPALEGLACDEEGFVLAAEDGRVQGTERTWAAGDGVASPIKFGGLASHQGRVAAAAVARLAGASAPDQGEPVIHGRLMTGRRTRRLRPRGDAEGAPLWWPHGKVAGEFLPRWLAGHGVAPAAGAEPPAGSAVTIERSVRAMKAPEYQYLFELAREYRSDDPATAAVGSRIRKLEPPIATSPLWHKRTSPK